MKNHLFLTLFILVSCQASIEKEGTADELTTKISLEKVDSVTVEGVLAKVFLFQGPSDDGYLFRDLVTTEVYRFDEEGELIEQWNKEGDVPGKFSMASGNFQFNREGQAVVLDIMNGLKVLELDGSVVDDYPIYQNQVSLGATFSLFDTEQIIERNGEEYLLYSLDIIEEYDGVYEEEFLSNRKNLLLTNLKTNETQKLLPFPESSVFLNEEVFYFRDLRPVFHYDQKAEKLYLMFQGENVLYTYDWSNEQPELISSVKLDLERFEIAEGFEPGSIVLGKISEFEKRPFPSTIINLSKYGDDLLITYSPTPQDKSAIARVIAKDATDETKQKLREEAKQKTILLSSDGEMIYLDFPEMYYTSFKVIGDDIFWMKKPDPNVEAENFTLYRGRLKKE